MKLCGICKSKPVRGKGQSWCKACRNIRERHAYYTKRRETALLAKYGITLQKYYDMYDAQDGRCAICEARKPTLDVDHNHGTGTVRQLLCRLCNVLTGHVERRPELIGKIKAYLGRH